jgi:site-specific recombinase XerD
MDCVCQIERHPFLSYSLSVCTAYLCYTHVSCFFATIGRIDRSVGRDNMLLAEMVSLFLDSRRRGVDGAKKRCTPKTIRIYQSNLKTFTNFLQTDAKDSTGAGGITRYEHIKRPHIAGFLDWMEEKTTKKEWSLSTKLQVLRTLRVFSNWVDRDEDCQAENLEGFQRRLPVIEKNPRRADIPELQECITFKDTFNTERTWQYRDYVATALMLDTGVRIGEVCNLRVDCILWDTKTLFVNGKTGPRPIAVTPDMLKLLKGWLKRREACRQASGSPYVFIARTSPQMTPEGFRQSFSKHRKKFTLPRITAHTFRHTFCRNYLQEGGHLDRLRNMTGHKSYDQLLGYLDQAKVGNVEAQKELEKVSILRRNKK